jgi:phosphatidylglycerol lysyltransferase
MEPDVSRARELVMRYGYNPTAYQTLNPGFRYYFSRAAEGFAAYVPWGRTWVVAGAPVCAEGDLAGVVADVEGAAREVGCSVCYAAAAGRLRDLLAGSARHSTITLGAEPVWDPRGWGELVARERSIRSQVGRARNKGVTAGEAPAIAARTDAGLRRVLSEWLGTKLLPPMHFLNGSDPAAGPVGDRLLYVAQRAGEAVAFLLASPVPGRGGYLVEQLARSPGAPNGTAELLIDCAMRGMAARGAGYATLGLVPLSKNAGPMGGNPAWVRPAFAWARAHGRRFYHFDGLEAFRRKLHPGRWEAVYAIVNRPRFSPGALYAMGAVTVGGSPLPVLARAVGSAVRQEVRALRARL